MHTHTHTLSPRPIGLRGPAADSKPFLPTSPTTHLPSPPRPFGPVLPGRRTHLNLTLICPSFTLSVYTHTHTLSYAMVFMPVRAGKVKGYKSQGKKRKEHAETRARTKTLKKKKCHRVTSSFLFNIIDGVRSCWYELCHPLCVIYIRQHSTQLIHSSHY